MFLFSSAQASSTSWEYSCEFSVMGDRPWFLLTSLNVNANRCLAISACYSICICFYFLYILRAIRCLHFSLMRHNDSSSIVIRWRATLPRVIAMKTKPSSLRVSGSTIKSVKHHSRYVNKSKVTSLNTINRFAFVLSRGMNQSTYIKEASVEKLRRAICAHRN